jgi:sphingomyelin phosphodiesterase
LQAAITQVKSLAENNVFAKNTCALCDAALQIGKFLALAAPEQVSPYFTLLSEQLKLSSNFPLMFGPTTLGPVVAQVLANADIAGYDGQVRLGLVPLICP